MFAASAFIIGFIFSLRETWKQMKRIIYKDEPGAARHNLRVLNEGTWIINFKMIGFVFIPTLVGHGIDLLLGTTWLLGE